MSPCNRFLRANLPSGKSLHYYKPKLVEEQTPWGKTNVNISYLATKTGKTFRNSIWRGTLIENLAQGIAREILVAKMLKLDKLGYDIRLSTYDEVMVMVPDKDIYSVSTLDSILQEDLPWAPGLPIAAEGFETIRYRKD